MNNEDQIVASDIETIVEEKEPETAPRYFGAYRLIRQLGEGSYATVYLARDGFDRSVALKILKKQYSFDESFLEQFQREAQTAAKLNHEHIITIFDQGEVEGQFYIAMEYAPEGTLQELIRQQGDERLSRTTIKNITSQIAEALDFAHANGVIHRDIKPSNILMGYSNKVKLADFGIAKAEGSGTAGVSTTVKGTFLYMAPEQANPSERESNSVDIYALAVVVYEMLSNYLPFDDRGGDFATLIQNKRNAKIRRMEEVPGYVAKVIYDALRPDPEERPRTAGDFANRFRNAAQQWERSTAENRDKQDLAGLAFLAMEQEKWVDAKAHWETLTRFGPSKLAQENLQKVEREISLQNAWTNVSESFGKAEWQSAIEALNEILQIDPDNVEAPKKLLEANQQIHWQELYERGESAFNQEDYTIAVEAFSQIFAENPDYRNVNARLEEFRQNQIKDEINRMREMTLFALAEGELDLANQHMSKINELAPNKQFGVESFIDRFNKVMEKINQERKQTKQTKIDLIKSSQEKEQLIANQNQTIEQLNKDLNQNESCISDQKLEIEQAHKQIDNLRKELIQRLYQYLEDLDSTVESLNTNLLTRNAAKDLIAHLRKRIIEIAARGEQLENLEE